MSIKGFPFAGKSTIDISGPFREPIALFEEFLQWNSVTSTGSYSTTNDAAPWRSGVVGSSTYLTVDDVDGGAIRLTSGNTANDEAALQATGASIFCVSAASLFVPARQVSAKIRFRASSITTVSHYFGLWVKDSVTATASPLTGTQPRGLGFVITNGVVNYITKTHADVATTATATGFGSIVANATIASAIWYTLEARMETDNSFTLLVNDVPYVQRLTLNVPLSATAGLSPAFGMKNTGGVTAPLMDIDYVYAAVEAPTLGR